MTAPAAASIREFVREDTRAVAGFLAAYFAEFGPDVWERALDRMLWENPWSGKKLARGWILEHHDDGIVGFLGSIPHPFYVVDADLAAAATTAWCVAPRHRSMGLLLAEAFLEQENADLLVSTTANPISGALFERLGFKRVQPDTLAQVLYWVTDPASFARGAAMHVTGSKTIASIAALAGALPLTISETLRSAGAGRSGNGDTELTTLQAFETEWQRCWEEWRPGLITGVRTPEQMNWRLAGVSRTIAARSAGGELLGYVACKTFADYAGALRRLRVVDLWAQPGRPEIARALIGEARRTAAELGCGSLEVFGMSDTIRAALAPLRPRLRTLATWPYYIRPRGRKLTAALADTARWHPTEYDGDSPFTAGAA